MRHATQRGCESASPGSWQREGDSNDVLIQIGIGSRNFEGYA